MVATDVSRVLLVVRVGSVNLLDVIMAVGKLLLGFMVGGKLLKLDTRDVVLIQVSLVGLCVLVKIVLMGTVPGLVELAASVIMLVGSVS